MQKYHEDLELAAAAAGGDRQAQILVSERLFEKIRANCFYLAGMDRDFDDLVQLSLLEVLKSLRTYSGKSKLETWAERITVRTALRYLKRRRSKESVVLHGVETEGVSGESQERFTGSRQLREVINKLFWQLKPERRTVLMLRFVHRHSIAEIAEITEAPVNTVRDRLRVGKARLQKLMTKEPAIADWIREPGQ